MPNVDLSDPKTGCGPTHHMACACREANFRQLIKAARELVEDSACYSACFIEDEMKGHLLKIKELLLEWE